MREKAVVALLLVDVVSRGMTSALELAGTSGSGGVAAICLGGETGRAGLDLTGGDSDLDEMGVSEATAALAATTGATGGSANLTGAAVAAEAAEVVVSAKRLLDAKTGLLTTEAAKLLDLSGTGELAATGSGLFSRLGVALARPD